MNPKPRTYESEALKPIHAFFEGNLDFAELNQELERILTEFEK